MANVFVDSTTILYPLDPREESKGQKALEWLRKLKERDCLTISPQVLNEAYWVVSRRAQFAGARAGIRGYLTTLTVWTTTSLDATITLEAWTLQDRYRLGFWDSLLLASANRAGCSHFLSEDLNDGQLYGGVQVVNPFRHDPQDVLGRALRKS
jgi:predicted nucleic acid-binding protein